MKETFETFIVDDSNQKAYNTCKAIAYGKCCKPLAVIYATSGRGKTHLLNAVATRHCLEFSAKRFTAKELVDNYIHDIQFNKTIQFGRECYKYDIILIDEIEYLVAKDGTQSVFVDFLEKALQEGKYIVLTSEKTLIKMPVLKAFVVEHITTITVCKIYAPTKVLKRAYSSQLATMLKLEMTKNTIDYIARSFNGLVEIKGFMKKVRFLSEENKVCLKQIRQFIERV